MRVMVLVKANADTEAGKMPTTKQLTAMGAYNDELIKAGIMLAGDGLKPSNAGKRLNYNGAKPAVVDGPFAETKEHLGGFTAVEVADDEAARYWAGRLAVALDWPQEVHRFPSDLAEIIDRY